MGIAEREQLFSYLGAERTFGTNQLWVWMNIKTGAIESTPDEEVVRELERQLARLDVHFIERHDVSENILQRLGAKSGNIHVFKYWGDDFWEIRPMFDKVLLSFNEFSDFQNMGVVELRWDSQAVSGLEEQKHLG